MKSLFVLCLSVFLSVGFVAEADAKRFGKGGFGKSFKTSPFKKQSSPFQQKKADKTDNGSASGNQNNAVPSKAAPANGAAKGKGMMGGLMGGLLAGGIFAYLLGSGAFEGIQFMDIILMLLVAFIAFKLIRGFARPAPAAAAGYGQSPQREPVQTQFRQAQTEQSTSDSQVPMNVPPGFNQNAFLDGSLSHYRTLQEAWNKGDLNLVSEYVAPDLYAELHNQRKSMDVAPQTEILDLEAELIRADRTESAYELSILFRGRCKDEVEGSEDGIFDVWHLQKDANKEDAPWMIIGIEAEG